MTPATIRSAGGEFMQNEKLVVEEGAIFKLKEIAQRLRLDFIVRECEEVEGRLGSGSFNLVFLGQYKRGKSSLINALIGEQILPTGVTPVTAIISIIKYGENRVCTVKKQDGSSETIDLENIYLFATQEHNPDNVKNVDYLEIRLPSPLLKRGLFLVDTPGISSVFESNTKTTREFLQSVDAVVVVIGVDPPISYDELEVVKEVKGIVREPVFVINKVDKESRESVETVKRFTLDILKKEFGIERPAIFCISAKEGIMGKVSYDWAEFLGKIDEMVSNKSLIIEDSYKNTTQRISRRLLTEVDRLIQALSEPLENTKLKVERLSALREESEIFIRELGYRFQSEQDRISQLIDLEQKKFFDEHRAEIDGEFEKLFASFLNNSNESNEYYYKALHPLAEKYVGLWMEKIKGKVDMYYREFSERYIREFMEIAHRVDEITQDNSFSNLFEGLKGEMYPRSEFYFHHFMRYTSTSPFMVIAGVFVPRKRRLMMMKKELKDYMDWLIYANCSRYIGDINQRIIESRRRIEADFKDRIQFLLERMNSAIEYASLMKSEGEARIKGELENLRYIRSSVESILRGTNVQS